MPRGSPQYGPHETEAEARQADLIASTLEGIAYAGVANSAPAGAKVDVTVKAVEHEPGTVWPHPQDEGLYGFEGQVTVTPLFVSGDVPPHEFTHEAIEDANQASLLPPPPPEPAPSVYGQPQTADVWFGGINFRTGETFTTPRDLDEAFNTLAGHPHQTSIAGVHGFKSQPGLERPDIDPIAIITSLGTKAIFVGIENLLVEAAKGTATNFAWQQTVKEWFADGNATPMTAPELLAGVVKLLHEKGENELAKLDGELQRDRDENETAQREEDPLGPVSRPETDAQFFGPSSTKDADTPVQSDADFFGPSSTAQPAPPANAAPAPVPFDPSGTEHGHQFDPSGADHGHQFDPSGAVHVPADDAGQPFNMEAEAAANAQQNQVELDGGDRGPHVDPTTGGQPVSAQLPAFDPSTGDAAGHGPADSDSPNAVFDPSTDASAGAGTQSETAVPVGGTPGGSPSGEVGGGTAAGAGMDWGSDGGSGEGSSDSGDGDSSGADDLGG
jgi:hypothetical protein